MSYEEFQQRWESESGKERARFDARPVSELLADLRCGRFGTSYQLWYSIGARASLAEAGALLADVLDSDIDYLHRYHCAAALIEIGKLDPAACGPEHLSARGVHPVADRVAEVRQKLRLPPARPRTPGESDPAAESHRAEPSASSHVAPRHFIPAAPPPLPRSKVLTIFAWIVVALSALALPISVISAMMLVVGSDGTAHAEPLGVISVVFGPATTLAAGIGIWRRWRWAWLAMIAGLLLVVVSNLITIVSVETSPKEYVSPSGVPTTVVTDGFQSRWSTVGVSVLLLGFLLRRRVRLEFFPGGTPALPTRGQPATAVAPPPLPPIPMDRASASPPVRKTQGMGALAIFIAVFIALAASAGWMTVRGLGTGEIHFPARHISALRKVSLEHDPAKFWVVVACFGAVSGGSAGFALWLTREGIRSLRKTANP